METTLRDNRADGVLPTLLPTDEFTGQLANPKPPSVQEFLR
jgi:hypothetical protein